MTISKAGSTYTFSGQDKLGYDSKFTWDVDTDLVEVITYTLNGKRDDRSRRRDDHVHF